MFYLISSVLALFTVLPFINTILSLIRKRRQVNVNEIKIDYGIIITAYGDVAGAKKLVDSLKYQNSKNFTIYLVADNCKESLKDFDYPNLIICKPEVNLNSKVKSIDYAINKFEKEHNYIVILDADNLVHPEFLNEITEFHLTGIKAVQGKRIAKNLNTKIACLDSLGELYYNFVDRKALFESGSSSTLAGSGMSFELALYKKLKLANYNIVGGFDKVLQGLLVCGGYQIAFAEKALVYDEKVTDPNQLKKQRTRWLHAYFKYVKFGLFSLLEGLNNMSFNQIWFGINHLRPPFFILFSLLISGILISFFLNTTIFVVLITAFVIFGINIPFVLITAGASTEQWKALFMIPRFIFSQFLSLFKMRIASVNFLVTENKLVKDITEVMRK